MKTTSLFNLMLLARDARSTKGAERGLLYALLMRCRPDQNYSCFPSYRRLGIDTGYDPATLKRAAKALQDKGLIFRRTRLNRSTIFFINMAVLADQAAANRAADKAEREGALDTNNVDLPFGATLEVERLEAVESEETCEEWISGGKQ
ncbi:MAG: Helix-turn-helix domain [Bryobacterales bacterium]|nr:Helix-turn-helix domain [Bryobacterales bacterium]